MLSPLAKEDRSCNDMAMMRALALAFLVLGLAACAAGNRVPAPTVPDAPLRDGLARVTVTRTTDMLFVALAADISINDQRAGNLWRGETTVADVPAGQTAVMVTAFGSPGRSAVRFPTVPGGRYTVEVAPRGSSFVPVMALGYVGAMLDGAASGDQGGSFTLSITSAVPAIGTVAAPAPPPAAILTAQEREARLIELRRLRDRGLITDDVYREEQRLTLSR
jgi:hypothetical protein